MNLFKYFSKNSIHDVKVSGLSNFHNYFNVKMNYFNINHRMDIHQNV